MNMPPAAQGKGPGRRDRLAAIARATALCLGLSGCAEFPEVAKMEGPPGPPPSLQPLQGLLPEASPNVDPAPALAGRAAALRAKAAAIGTP
jgi:hypothetical protein